MNIDAIIKLGGSVIAPKNKKYYFCKKPVEKICTQLQNKKIIFVHGAGSFGHYLVHKHKLFGKINKLDAVSKVWCNIRNLNLQVMSVFLKLCINAVTIPPNCVVECNNGKITKFNKNVFVLYLKSGILPVTFGDITYDKTLNFTVVSGDLLMVEFSKIFQLKYTIFLTNVDGVYDKNGNVIKKVTQKNLSEIGNISEQGNDVTGGIFGKVQCALQISKFNRNTKVIIANCFIDNVLNKIFNNEVVGSEIKWI